MQDLEKTHLFKCQDAIKQIAKPLFDCTDISLFVLSRLYTNGSSIHLSNYPEGCADAITQKTVMTYKRLDHIICGNSTNSINNFHYYLHQKNNVSGNKILTAHGFNSGIVLVDPQDHYADCFTFASTQGREWGF